MAPRKSSSVCIFNCGLGRTEVRTRKYRKTQIDRGGVQGVDRVRELHVKRFCSIQVSCFANKDLREISPDAPVTRFISIRQRRTRYCIAQSHVAELRRLSRQTSFYVAKTFASSQLRKSHHSKLLAARQRTRPRIPVVTRNDASKACPRYEVHDLREQRLADIHGGVSGLATRKTSRKSALTFKPKPNRIGLEMLLCNDSLRNTCILTGRQ